MSLDVTLSNKEEVFDYNITHNLGKMASEAGIYYHLWRPEELDIQKAKELINPLVQALYLLETQPKLFKKHEPENGWGTYDGLVKFVTEYLKACRENPEAEISISR